MRNELKRVADKDKKEYLDSIWDDIMESQRAGIYDIMYMNTKGLGAKENHGIQNIAVDMFKAQKLLYKTSMPTENLGELYYRGPIRA
jgi:hypothetical protein